VPIAMLRYRLLGGLQRRIGERSTLLPLFVDAQVFVLSHPAFDSPFPSWHTYTLYICE
jgi:hypothetical protein